ILLGPLSLRLDRELDENTSLWSVCGLVNLVSSLAERLHHRVVLGEDDPAEVVLAPRSPVDARRLTGQQGHGARRLNRGGLDRLTDAQPLRVLPVVVLNGLVAFVHHLTELRHAVIVSEVGDTRHRGTDAPVALHDRVGPLPVSGEQGYGLGVEVGELQSPAIILY